MSMQDPRALSVLPPNVALRAEHVGTITDALVIDLLDQLHEAHKLVEEHLNRQLDEVSVKLADARGRLHAIRAITDALDALDPAGWWDTWRPEENDG